MQFLVKFPFPGQALLFGRRQEVSAQGCKTKNINKKKKKKKKTIKTFKKLQKKEEDKNKNYE